MRWKIFKISQDDEAGSATLPKNIKFKINYCLLFF